jgi:hypothetical protein
MRERREGGIDSAADETRDPTDAPVHKTGARNPSDAVLHAFHHSGYTHRAIDDESIQSAKVGGSHR